MLNIQSVRMHTKIHTHPYTRKQETRTSNKGQERQEKKNPSVSQSHQQSRQLVKARKKPTRHCLPQTFFRPTPPAIATKRQWKPALLLSVLGLLVTKKRAAQNLQEVHLNPKCRPRCTKGGQPRQGTVENDPTRSTVENDMA